LNRIGGTRCSGGLDSLFPFLLPRPSSALALNHVNQVRIYLDLSLSEQGHDFLHLDFGVLAQDLSDECGFVDARAVRFLLRLTELPDGTRDTIVVILWTDA
jgi:hypothetical protein